MLAAASCARSTDASPCTGGQILTFSITATTVIGVRFMTVPPFGHVSAPSRAPFILELCVARILVAANSGEARMT